MSSPQSSVAFGAPGIEPRWSSSAKEGVGTAYHTSCRAWFTLSHGVVNEIYYPHVDQPNTRDFQFLITDGETFCHEEKRDLDHCIEYPERDCVFYRLTNSEPQGRYRIAKHVLTDPHRSVLLVHTKVEVPDESLRGKLRLYALMAPYGAGNSGRCCEIGASTLIHAQREGVHLVMACSSGFSRRSVGYVGASDGWQDLTGNLKMDWEFSTAERGNIALTGESDLPSHGEFRIEVIDRVIKRGLPQGPGWRRYNHDGYGQKDDGGAFDGGGVGRCWPILTGERGHYELAAGRDPLPFIKTMEDFANQGGMITEQLWDADDLPGDRMKRGGPTGAAMPLCWSHAEYVSLVRSHHDGVCFDRIEPAFQRYVVNPVQSHHEIWSLRHPLRRMPRGKILRILLAAEATVVWSTDDWARTNRTDTIHESGLNLWFADFPTAEWVRGSVIAFTCFWKRDQRWEGRNWQVSVL